MKPIGLYVHIPFCKSRCYYCDFNTYAGIEAYIEDYVNALLNEMHLYHKYHGKVPLKTIFIGGGTPTVLTSSQLVQVIEGIYRNFDTSCTVEFSIESNPGTLTKEKLLLLKKLGINRLSMGVQAVQDSLLKAIGRIHTFDDFLSNYKTAREVGIDNINADMIFSLPNQTLVQWQNSLETISSLGLDHLSCYSLILEDGTKLYRDYQNGNLSVVDEETDRRMYELTAEVLQQKGYQQYEISNYAKHKKQCQHNLLYWHCEEYIGIGAGAHGYYKNERYSNIMDVVQYINQVHQQRLPVIERTSITKLDEQKEFMMLGFRLIEGLSKEEFRIRFNDNIVNLYPNEIKKYKSLGLLEETETHIYLTEKGLDVSNTIIADFL